MISKVQLNGGLYSTVFPMTR